MILSKRERLIVAVTLIAVSILVLDRYIVTPLLEGYSAAEARKETLLSQMRRNKRLLTLRRRIDPEWRRILDGGLKRDPAEAESQMLHAFGNWSEQTGLRLSLLRPERQPDKTDLREITFHIAGSGSMNSISRFLWRLETGEIPARLKSVQLRSRKEGIDDLALQLRVSTLYLAVPPPQTDDSDEIASKGGGE